jgi:hypothetical protein
LGDRGCRSPDIRSVKGLANFSPMSRILSAIETEQPRSPEQLKRRIVVSRPAQALPVLPAQRKTRLRKLTKGLLTPALQQQIQETSNQIQPVRVSAFTILRCISLAGLVHHSPNPLSLSHKDQRPHWP